MTRAAALWLGVACADGAPERRSTEPPCVGETWDAQAGVASVFRLDAAGREVAAHHTRFLLSATGARLEPLTTDGVDTEYADDGRVLSVARYASFGALENDFEAYLYDDDGRWVGVDGWLAGAWVYERRHSYDAAGRRVSSRWSSDDSAQNTYWTWDGARLIQEVTLDAESGALLSVEGRTYLHPAPSLDAIVDRLVFGVSSRSIERYDGERLILREDVTDEGAVYRTERWVYDAEGRLVERVVESGGRFVERFAYDEGGRPLTRTVDDDWNDDGRADMSFVQRWTWDCRG